MQRKGFLSGKMFAWCILQRRFAGHFEYMGSISCQSQLILDAWRRYLAAKGRFSCPGLLRECIRAIFCQECGPSPVRECASKVFHSKGAPSSAQNGSRKRFVQECGPSPVRERASKMLRLGPFGCTGERKMIIVLLCPRQLAFFGAVGLWAMLCCGVSGAGVAVDTNGGGAGGA